MSLMLYPIVKYSPSAKWVLGIGFALGIIGLLYRRVVGIELPWNIDVAFVAFPFISAGYYFGILRKTKCDKIHACFCWKGFWIAGVLYLALVYVNERMTGEKLDFATNMYGNPIISLIAALLGIYCSIFISMKIAPNSRILNYLGQNTHVYFAWHQSIVLPILLGLYKCLGLFQGTGAVNSMGRTVVTVSLIFILLYPVDRLLSKGKMRFCVGK